MDFFRTRRRDIGYLKVSQSVEQVPVIGQKKQLLKIYGGKR